MKRFVCLALVFAALVSVDALAAHPAHGATAQKLYAHRFQTGEKIGGLQWLLGGHKPSHFKIAAYRHPVNSVYDLYTSHAVRNMKYRLGWPQRSLRGDVVGTYFVQVLLGQVTRPRAYYLRVSKRLAELKKIEAQRAKTSCARLIISTMRSELGVQEQPFGSNSGPFINGGPPHGVRNYQSTTGAFFAPWCVSFAQWVWAQARVHSPRAWHGAIADNSAGAFYVAGWARQHGWARSVPKPAYGVVFLDRLGHMGIVESVTTTGFTSIEGNASNSVLRRFHPFGERPEMFVAVPGCDTG